MVKNEFKLMLLEKNKILGLIISISCILLLAVYISGYLEKRGSILEKFTLGYVNKDSSNYFSTYLGILKSSDLGNILNIKKLDELEAEELFKNNEIPLYLVIPENFIEDIQNGNNKSITLVTKNSSKFERNIIEKILKVGSSYLATTQSGIYSTIEVSEKLEIDDKIIRNEIIPKINLDYGIYFLSIGRYFDEKILGTTGDLELGEYYKKSTAFFLLMLSTGLFLGVIKEGTDKNIIKRYKLSKIQLWKVARNKLVSIYLTIIMYSFPLIGLFKIEYFGIIGLLTSQIFLISFIVKDNMKITAMMFYSFFTLFLSGGIIPLIYLPDFFRYLGIITPNYFITSGLDWLVFIHIVVYSTASYLIIRRKSVQ